MRAWEPEPGEVTPRNQGKPWACFKVFRDLGPGRTLKAAAAAYYQHPSDTLPEHLYNQVKKWATKFSWHERVEAFDAHYTMRERLALEEWRNHQAEDLGRREAALREQAIEARELALEQTLKMLRWPLVTQKTVELDESGTPVTLLFAPAGWSKATAATLYRLAMEGEPPEEDSDDLVDVSRWSEAELHQYVQLMRTAMNAERDTERDTERRQGPGAGT